MKKWMAAILCIAIALTVLAACQNDTEVPYVNSDGVLQEQQTPGTSTPANDQQGTSAPTGGEGQQTTEPTQGGQQGGQQTTQPTQGGQQGGQQTTEPTQGGQQTTEPTQGGQQGGQQTTEPTQGGQQGGSQTTEPTQGGQQTTQPTQGGQQGNEGSDYVPPKPEDCTYEEYMAMTGEQQEAFFNQFNGDFEAFFNWLNAAKAESDANSNDIVVDPDTTIDLESIFTTGE